MLSLWEKEFSSLSTSLLPYREAKLILTVENTCGTMATHSYPALVVIVRIDIASELGRLCAFRPLCYDFPTRLPVRRCF